MKTINPNHKVYSEYNYENQGTFHCIYRFRDVARGDVLDIGAGQGLNTDAIVADNPRVTSVTCLEVNPRAIVALKKKKYSVINKDLDDAKYELPKNKFDTIIMTDVVEHVLSPYAVLKNVFESLRPNGVLVLSTPDAHKSDVDEKHVSYFCYRGLVLTLQNVGFSHKNIVRVYNGVLSPTVTRIVSTIPIVNKLCNRGLYIIAKK